MKTYHAHGHTKSEALCDTFAEGDEVISDDELVSPDGRWMNCSRCFDIIHPRQPRTLAVDGV